MLYLPQLGESNMPGTKPFRLVIVAALGLCATASLAQAGNWPRFRGPNGSGIAPDKDIPVHWTEQDGVLWKTAVPGTGNSSPVIWGDFLFLQSARANGGERLLLCLRVSDGKILWTQAVPGGPAHKHAKNSWASSTPATDGERVYCLFWDGKDLSVHAFDFEGRSLWQHALGSLTSQHGAGASPVVFDGKVFVNNDQDGEAELIALDAKTGQAVWKAARQPFRACYSTPFICEEPGHAPELIVASTAGLTAYEPQTGSENWSWKWSFSGRPLRTVASPLAGPGWLFANSGDGSGDRHAVALKVDRQASGVKVALAWEEKRQLPYVPTMLLWGDHVYYVNDNGLAGCRDARTGTAAWTERLGGTVTASPVLIDGKIYAANEDGTVYVFAAAPRFQLLAKNNLGEPVFATPAVADNRLFIRGKTHLYCIGKAAAK
jgi:outer membrane protein assembly factor BamB